MMHVLAETSVAQTLPLWFDVTVMAVNGLLGAAVARSRNAPIFGTLFAAVLVGLGGGMVRDVLLGLEPVAISNWVYIPAVLVGGVLGALLFGRVLKKQSHFALIQGIVLGFLVTIGAQKALDYDTPVISAMVLGIVTASFGGMLADVMTGYRATIARQAHWIASALVGGAIVFVLISIWIGFWPAVIVSVIVTSALRYASQVRNWPSPKWPGEPMSTPDNPPT
jgi:uncharacterized membrane protein YeiH